MGWKVGIILGAHRSKETHSISSRIDVGSSIIIHLKPHLKNQGERREVYVVSESYCQERNKNLLAIKVKKRRRMKTSSVYTQHKTRFTFQESLVYQTSHINNNRQERSLQERSGKKWLGLPLLRIIYFSHSSTNWLNSVDCWTLYLISDYHMNT